MVSTRGRYSYRSLLFSLLAVASSAVVRSVQPSWAGGSSIDAGDFRAAEIRFGVIEPPVIAQKDIGARAPVSNQQPEPMALECSGFIWTNDRLLVTSDRHGHMLFSIPIQLDTVSIGDPKPIRVISNEEKLIEDAESITIRTDPSSNRALYVLSSLSNDRNELPLPKRRHLLRCPLNSSNEPDSGRASVVSAERIRELLQLEFNAIGIKPYLAYNKDFVGAEKNTYRWGNLEGIAFVPGSGNLICGMRNPLLGGRALLCVVAGVNYAFDNGDVSRLEVSDLFCLDLGGRGISDLSWDGVTLGYLISAARSNGPKLDKDQAYPPNQLDSALFWWSGHKHEAPILFATVPDMKVEAICRLGNTRFIAIGSDERDESEGREQRQSVLTILDFTGFK